MRISRSRLPRLVRHASMGHSPTLPSECGLRLVAQAEPVPQNIIAWHPVDAGFAAPALADQFTACSSAVCGNRVRQCRAQIKIATDALVIGTVKAEHGLCVSQVDGVFDFAGLGQTDWGEMREVHRQ